MKKITSDNLECENNIIDFISSFDLKISSFVNEISNKIKEISFDQEQAITFVLTNDLDSKSVFNNPKKQGIYLFELNLESANLTGTKRETKIKNFAEDWSNKKNNPLFSSGVIKKRLELRANFNEQWLPLYVGKNKDVYKRIIEHIDLSSIKSTYAMKLKERTNLHGLEFRVSIIEIDVNNYDFIVPHIERSLRDIYHPLIGKQ
ncbi:hypothetical protein [Flavobacterium cyclinae]|uniref:hypothetical protein n=1 Tax=Flavobacterium cyclinae TaxID=2895947 RepID=UPI001E33E731|nr:hypothetical protein [Flavobacterium cyclinae]UGS19866.1 hypothetical protein LOS86_07500 [Flavobacterium cyclinae]